MILVNAVYFKGPWKNPFKPSNTCERDFYIDKRKTKKVPTMYQETNMMYGELPDLKARFVAILYEVMKITSDIIIFILDRITLKLYSNFSSLIQNYEFSMIIVLPEEIDGLSEVEQKVKNIRISVLLENLKSAEVTLYLPKFKIESAIELNDVLSEVSSRIYLAYFNTYL